ncbi:General transcription factor II-I repeat domain-containing protein 2A [Varanus komodoensis]|nr:General transcription factor II-I repeat domain-containing protein 2A [Varanus komodoensis]
MIAKAGKPFKDGEFIKECMLQAASIVCPEKKGQFSNITLSANTVAERISDLSGNIYDQLCEKAKHFHAYSVALDESTDVTDTAQLAIYVHGVDNNFEVMEELLTVIPMHGQTTAQEIFRQLCDAIADAGLLWKSFAGIITDGAPSMTGRRNGVVALVQRKLEEEAVEEAIALHCIIHQQALCSKCLKFDNVMSDVVKCINHIRSRGLKHRQFRAFLEEIESAYEDVLYYTEVPSREAKPRDIRIDAVAKRDLPIITSCFSAPALSFWNFLPQTVKSKHQNLLNSILMHHDAFAMFP